MRNDGRARAHPWPLNAQCGITEHIHQLLADLIIGNDRSCATVIEYELRAGILCGDDRRSCGHRLRVRQSEPFVATRETEHPGPLVQLGELVVARSIPPSNVRPRWASVADHVQLGRRNPRQHLTLKGIKQELAALTPLPGTHEQHYWRLRPVRAGDQRDVDRIGQHAKRVVSRSLIGRAHVTPRSQSRSQHLQREGNSLTEAALHSSGRSRFM